MVDVQWLCWNMLVYRRSAIKFHQVCFPFWRETGGGGHWKDHCEWNASNKYSSQKFQMSSSPSVPRRCCQVPESLDCVLAAYAQPAHMSMSSYLSSVTMITWKKSVTITNPAPCWLIIPQYGQLCAWEGGCQLFAGPLKFTSMISYNKVGPTIVINGVIHGLIIPIWLAL